MPLLAVAAIAGGAAVATGVVAASTMAMIGIGATVVGKLTKSKELMQIGAGLSLGTGVVSLAQGAFGATSAAEGAGSAVAGSGDAAFDAWAAEQGAAEMAAGGADAFGGTTPSWASASSAPAATEGVAKGLLNSSTKGVTDQASANLSGAADDIASPALKFAESSGAIAPPAGTDPGSISQWWSSLPEARKNMILQMGGKAVGGLFEGWTQEQKMALERERFNLEQQKYNTSVANANAQPTTIKPLAVAGGLLNARRG